MNAKDQDKSKELPISKDTEIIQGEKKTFFNAMSIHIKIEEATRTYTHIHRCFHGKRAIRKQQQIQLRNYSYSILLRIPMI